MLEMSAYAGANFDSSNMIRFDKLDLTISQLAELVPAIVRCSENLPNSSGKYVGEASKPFQFKNIKRSDLSDGLSEAIADLGALQKKLGFDEGVYISEYDLDKALGEMWIHIVDDDKVQSLISNLQKYFKLAKSKINIDLSQSIFDSIERANLRYFEIPVFTDQSFDKKWALESSLDAFSSLLNLQRSFSWSDKLSNSVYSTDKKTKKFCLDLVQQNALRFISCLRAGKTGKLSRWAQDGHTELDDLNPDNMKNFILLPTPAELDQWYPDTGAPGNTLGGGSQRSLPGELGSARNPEVLPPEGGDAWS
ncbi:MAG: hypothetical protein SFU25_05380 [Candidatus Caenarcaniphilales bacterium]|nr:hypothetical protein [Candidatus Caenarcaniphilales bacterium]